jgi:hypothetical protein
MFSIPDLANKQGIRKGQSEIVSCVVFILTSMNWIIPLENRAEIQGDNAI